MFWIGFAVGAVVALVAVGVLLVLFIRKPPMFLPW